MSLAAAVEQNNSALRAAAEPEMRRMLAVLKQAEGEAAAGLRAWARTAAPDGRYTAHQHRALLYQLRAARATIESKLGIAAALDLTEEGRAAARKAVRSLRAVVAAGHREFGTPALRIDDALVLQRADNLLIDKHASSAARYAGNVKADIQARLVRGMVSAKTNEEVVDSLLAGKMPGRLSSLGIVNKAGEAADSVFSTHRSWADRLVRTENAYAFNQGHEAGVVEANERDPGYVKKWDAVNEGARRKVKGKKGKSRTCDICLRLDGETVAPDAKFSIGVRIPPAHPYCRCTVLAWRLEWDR